MAAGQITGTHKVPRSREVWSEGPSRSKYCSDLLFSRPWIGMASSYGAPSAPHILESQADIRCRWSIAAASPADRPSASNVSLGGIPIHHAADQPWGLLKRRSVQYLDLLGPSLQTSRERGTLCVPVIWPAAIRPIRYQSWWKLTHS